MKIRPITSPTTKDAYRLLHEGALALAQIERNGIKINTQRLEFHLKETEKKVQELEQELKADPIFSLWRKEYGASSNLDSGPQLAHVLYDLLSVECKAWTTGGEKGQRKPSVSEKALQGVDHPFVKKLFEAKHLKKVVGTYLKGIRREVAPDGRLHPFFDLHTVVSGRGSSSSPNFQNIPRRYELLSKLVRKCVVASHGNHFVEIDFRSSEVVVNACINKDPVLLNYVRTNTGNMHRDAAVELFFLQPGEVTKRVRDRAKNQFVFAAFYGSFYAKTAPALWEDLLADKTLTAGPEGPRLVDHLKSKGIQELGACDPALTPKRGTFEAHVKDVEDAMWRKFSVYHQWRKDQWANYQKKGYFDLPTGFRVQWGKGGLLGRNDAICYPAQGASFHCLLFTLIRLQEFLEKNKMKSMIVGQVHDSLEIDATPEELPLVLDEVERIVSIDLPQYWPWIIAPMAVEVECSGIHGSWWAKRPWKKIDGVWGLAVD